MSAAQLVTPARVHLQQYIDALNRGWSPDNVRGRAAAEEQLERINANADRFLESLVDEEARGDPIKLPDGTIVQRLPGFVSWIWDGEFCGSIGFRWQRGTCELPAHVLGHIGYTVVPWKQGRGHATGALRQLLPLARARGLSYVDLTTDPDNVASQKVITANGGYLKERFHKAAAYGGAESLRFRIDLQ
jgi:predicted acetyltransferase